MDFRTYIQDKKIIFVGPAASIRGKNFGTWIDSFDFVARSNGAIYLIDEPEYVQDYGSRCDGLWVNVQFAREMSPFPLSQWEKKGVKFVTFKGSKKRNSNSTIQLRSLPSEVLPLHNQIKNILYGPMILKDILLHNPKELWITGMDFYRTKPPVFIPGDYREYYPNYLPKKIRDKADIKNLGRIDPHDQISNTNYIYQLYEEGLIKADEITKELMEKVLE